MNRTGSPLLENPEILPARTPGVGFLGPETPKQGYQAALRGWEAEDALRPRPLPFPASDRLVVPPHQRAGFGVFGGDQGGPDDGIGARHAGTRGLTESPGASAPQNR